MIEEHSFEEYTKVRDRFNFNCICFTTSVALFHFPDDCQSVMSLLFKASGGVSCSVKGDYQPTSQSPLHNGPSGL